MMRVGVLSTAHSHAYSYMHALQQLDSVTVVGFHDDDAERERNFLQHFEVVSFKQPDELARQSDAIVICAENGRHREFFDVAAEHGCAILCEKPLATTLADGEHMVRRAKETGVTLFMALPVRFLPSVGRIRNVVKQGRIGKVVAMTGTNHGSMPGGWFADRKLAGGGAVMDHTPHVIDIMRWILDSEVTEVYCEADETLYDLGIDDCGIVTMQFDNGVCATLDPSWSRLPTHPTWGDVTLEIVGTEGVVSLDAFADKLDLYAEGRSTHRYNYYGDDMDFHLIAEFIRCAKTKSSSPILAGGLDGLRALEVCMAAYQSAESGKPVRIGHHDI